MNAATQETHEGFTLVRIENDFVSVAVAPELGAKIVSLRDRRNGREWMWRPPGPLRLWANAAGDAYIRGTFVGADECLPTVIACAWSGRALPDHGEVWSVPWEIDATARARGEIRTSVRLSMSPFLFSRTMRLEGATVRLDYTLQNVGSQPEAWLWALHPLLTFEPGDRIALPPEVAEIWVEEATRPGTRPGERWRWPSPAADIQLDALQLESMAAKLKAFAGPLHGEAWARVSNPSSGAALTMRWSTTELPYFGLWITRGGFKGWHHCAFEMSNASTSALDTADRRAALPRLPAGATARWSVEIELGERPAAT